MKRPIDNQLFKQIENLIGELPVISVEEFKQLVPMFASPDLEIRTLAANVLFQTYFLNIPGTIELLLELYPCSLLSEMKWITENSPEDQDYDNKLIEILTEWKSSDMMINQ